MEKAKWVLVHDDGPCANGKLLTPLVDFKCPVCNISPDMQSTAFIFHCPTHGVRLNKDKTCPTCKKKFNTRVAEF